MRYVREAHCKRSLRVESLWVSVSLIAAALVIAPFAFAQHGVHVELRAIAISAGLAVLLPLLPYALEMSALRRISAPSFGILMSIEPAFGALAGFVVLGQPMSTLQSVGLLLVVFASVGNIASSSFSRR